MEVDEVVDEEGDDAVDEEGDDAVDGADDEEVDEVDVAVGCGSVTAAEHAAIANISTPTATDLCIITSPP
ncbi:MAG: hypothetical protein O2815_08755 [Actinomycetota bacterium]|nr:hypothetical protein [Actinomycetota bacterium]